MSALQHPAELNPLQQFRQANALFKKTSRAKNPAWYQEALDLDFQLHIRTDGAGVVAFLHDRREDLWAHGPPLTERHLLDPEAMTAYVAEAVKHARSAGGNSLGVVLHVADEFSLTEIKLEFHDRDAFEQLREAAINDPASILADSITPDQSSWRILPYFAPESPTIATAVTISRRYDPTLAALRALGASEDFPVITCALSAPLIAILGIHGAVTRTEGRPSVAILQYPFFTVLAFFNKNSDLLLIRTQLHRGLRRPPNFRHAIATTMASLELDAPDIYVFGLGQDVDRTLLSDLQPVFPTSHIQEVQVPNTGVILPWCAECVISTRIPEIDETLPGITLRALREDRWAFQDFLPASKETSEIYPAKSEMTLLRGLRFVRIAAVLAGIVVIGWLIYGVFQIRSSPEWAFEPSEAQSIKMRLATLNMERQKTEHWDSLLEDRSKAWPTMESLSRLFPENSGVLVKTFTYASRPDTIPGQAKVGFVREWKISGLMKDEAIELLNTLNTREGIAAHFNEIARVTGNSAFRTDIGTRSLVVNIRTQESNLYRPGAPATDDLVLGGGATDSTYPFTFDLGITQRFEATDPLAVLVANAP